MANRGTTPIVWFSYRANLSENYTLMIFILAIARRLRPAPRSSAFQFDVSSNVDFALHPSYTHVPLFPSVFLPKHKDGRAFINSPLPREGNLILVPLPGYHIHYVYLALSRSPCRATIAMRIIMSKRSRMRAR